MTSELLSAREIAPSILSADFARLGEQVAAVMDAGARVIHIDVMDGHFVPPITYGPIIVGALADQVHDRGGILDVHLMIERPERQVAEFVKAGSDSITVHCEATPHIHYALQAIREGGCGAGLAICPATPADVVTEAVADGMVDLVLCMTVNPGWGNQKLIQRALTKTEQLREMLPDGVGLEVDGGVNVSTAAACSGAGANLLVAGSAVFGTEDPQAAFAAISAAAWPSR